MSLNALQNTRTGKSRAGTGEIFVGVICSNSSTWLAPLCLLSGQPPPPASAQEVKSSSVEESILMNSESILINHQPSASFSLTQEAMRKGDTEV